MEHVAAALGRCKSSCRRQAAHLQLLLSRPVIRSQLGSTQTTVPGDAMEMANVCLTCLSKHGGSFWCTCERNCQSFVTCMSCGVSWVFGVPGERERRTGTNLCSLSRDLIGGMFYWTDRREKSPWLVIGKLENSFEQQEAASDTQGNTVPPAGGAM